MSTDELSLFHVKCWSDIQVDVASVPSGSAELESLTRESHDLSFLQIRHLSRVIHIYRGCKKMGTHFKK